MPTLRYRVFDPETPRDLPVELIQEWESERLLSVGDEAMVNGVNWRVAKIEAEADPEFAGRLYFESA